MIQFCFELKKQARYRLIVKVSCNYNRRGVTAGMKGANHRQ